MFIPEEQFAPLQKATLLQKFDANETIFLERQLTQVRARSFTVQYPVPMGRQFVPKANDIDSATPSYVYNVYDASGMAKFISYKANDIPRVDMTAREVLGKVHPIACAYGWDLNELRNAARTGQNVSDMKAKAAADFIERAIDMIIAYGSLPDETGALPDVGLTGFVNNAAVIALGIVSLGWWVNPTPLSADTIMGQLNTLVGEVGVFSDNIWNVNTLLLPPAHYNRINTQVYSTLTGETILTVFKRNHPEITLIAPWNRLKTAGATGGPRAIAYDRDARNMEAVIPQEMEILPPEMQGFEVLYNCHARCGGTKIYQPLSMRYGDFATS